MLWSKKPNYLVKYSRNIISNSPFYNIFLFLDTPHCLEVVVAGSFLPSSSFQSIKPKVNGFLSFSLSPVPHYVCTYLSVSSQNSGVSFSPRPLYVLSLALLLPHSSRSRSLRWQREKRSLATIEEKGKKRVVPFLCGISLSVREQCSLALSPSFLALAFEKSVCSLTLRASLLSPSLPIGCAAFLSSFVSRAQCCSPYHNRKSM